MRSQTGILGSIISAASLSIILSISLIPILVDDAFAGIVPDPVQLGDFKCYDTSEIESNNVVQYPVDVFLEDQQFDESGVYHVDPIGLWCNPVEKLEGTGWPSPSPEPDVEQHYKPYEVCNDPAPGDNCDSINTLIVIHDQFGDHPTIVLDPVELWVPAVKSGGFTGLAEDPDTHYLCYNIETYSIDETGKVSDQFGQGVTDELFRGFKFCTPVEKTFQKHSNFHNNPQDLVCYSIVTPIEADFDLSFKSTDQIDIFSFGENLDGPIIREHSLCVVATKSFPVGGTVLSPDSVSLLVLEAQSTAIWWLPAVVMAGVGIALFKIRKKT